MEKNRCTPAFAALGRPEWMVSGSWPSLRSTFIDGTGWHTPGDYTFRDSGRDVSGEPSFDMATSSVSTASEFSRGTANVTSR
jgi:hypothetical protein